MIKKLLLLSALFSPLFASDDENQATAITTTNPIVGKIEKFSSVLGTFEASKETTLKAETAGTIKTIHFKDGALVKAGDLLISMDSKIAKAHYEQALAQHKLAMDKKNRGEKLLKTSTITKENFEELLSQEKQAEANLSAAQTSLEHLSIKAPFDGTIGFKTERVHTFVEAGTPLVTIVDLMPLDIDFYVPENNTDHMHIGKRVFIKPFFKQKDTLEAKITSVDARLDVHHQLKVRAELLNPAPNIYPGHSARVSIPLDIHEKALLVPLQSLRIKEKASYAFIIKDKMAYETKVKIGWRMGEWVEILEGLTLKDVLAYEGSFKLSDEEPVKIKAHKVLKKED